MNTSTDHEFPSKRPRTDTPDLSELSLSSSSTYAHRKSLPDRAKIFNAADSVYFSKSSALVYHFVDIYDVVEDDLGRLKSCTFKCGICHGGNWKWLKDGPGKGSTTNMNNHMKEKHARIWSSAQQADNAARGVSVASDQSSMKSIPLDNHPQHFSVDEFYRLLTRWIITGNQPFTEIENEEFRDVLLYLKPALEGHLVQSQAIRDRIFAHAGAMRKQTGRYLSLLPGLIAIACDAWTSPNRIAFLAITGSWITQDWHMEETVLDFAELSGAHDGQNMADIVATAVTELGIGDKIVALVSDNASNNGTLVRHLGTKLKEHLSSSSRWDSKKAHIRCLAHIIHLSVMSLLLGVRAIPQATDTRNFLPDDHLLTPNEAEALVSDSHLESMEGDDQDLPDIDPSVNLSSAIDKIRKIAKIVRSSPQRMELFRTTAARIEEDNEQQARSEDRKYSKRVVKNLIIDVVTRWNSVYLMLERALEFSEAINALTSHSKIKIYRKYALSQSDWAAISLICRWLKYFRSASDTVAAEKYPTLSYSLRIYYLLITHVSDLENDQTVRHTPSLLAGIQTCKNKLLEFFDRSTFSSEYYYFAAILDPRFKDTLFRSNESLTASLFSESWLNNCSESFKNTFQTYYGATDSSFVPRSASAAPSEETDDFKRAWRAQLPSLDYANPTPPTLTEEIYAYLAEPPTTMAPLDWWRLNAQRFPRLAAMARDFLCIPGTSVAVERVFSTGRDVISVRRASLSAETIRTLITYRAGILLEKNVLRSST